VGVLGPRDAPEPDIVVAIVRVIIVAERRPQVRRIVVPRRAAVVIDPPLTPCVNQPREKRNRHAMVKEEKGKSV